MVAGASLHIFIQTYKSVCSSMYIIIDTHTHTQIKIVCMANINYNFCFVPILYCLVVHADFLKNLQIMTA